MKKLLQPLSPYKVELIAKQLKENPYLSVVHEINIRGIYHRKLYDIEWYGTLESKKEPFFFPVTHATFRDNIYLFAGKDDVDKAFQEFIKEGWETSISVIEQAACTFLHVPISSGESIPLRKKNNFIHPLTPLEMRTATKTMERDVCAMMAFDINEVLIDATRCNRKVNGTILPSVKNILNAGKMPHLQKSVIERVIESYQNVGWKISKDGDLRYFIDKRSIKK